VLWAWIPVVIAATCPDYSAAQVLGDLGEHGPTEASGVAASRSRPGVFFAHDDGGDPVLHAFDAGGVWLETHGVDGAAVTDWEDIASGPCPDSGDCLFIADIGDNDGSRITVDVYVVEEPGAGQDTSVQSHWRLQWPDGPVDAETILVHPLDGDVTLLSKDPGGSSLIGRLPADLGTSIRTLDVIGTLELTAVDEGDRLVTGGAWDLEGERLVLRTRERVLAWDTDPCAPDAHWQDVPQGWETPAMPRAEGVDFDLAGGLIYVGEGSPAPVAGQACPDLIPGTGQCLDDDDDDEDADCGCRGDGSTAWVLLPLCLGLRRRQLGLPTQPLLARLAGRIRAKQGSGTFC